VEALALQLKAILQRVPDPRGKQGQDYKLWSILGLIILSPLCGRRGMKAAFVLGRSLTRRQKARLGFVRGKSPCHATLTETLRVIDAQALADVLGSLGLQQSGGAQHIAIDGKTMRASKDSNGRAEHVLSAFCGDLQTVLGHEASRGKGLEIPDALKLLERLDVKGKIVTGDAIFLPEVDYCQDRRARRRLCPSGQGQSEGTAAGYRNGLQRAGFSPCAHGIAASKRHMGASNGAPSMCCRPPPPGLSASGRRSGKSAVSNVGANSRKTVSGNRRNTRSFISSPA
jgi:hypothetical protein